MGGYFDTEKGINEYIQTARGYDGAKLIEILRKYLPDQSTVLEIDMGPGVDLDILEKYYTVMGSDSSSLFLERYKSKNKDVSRI